MSSECDKTKGYIRLGMEFTAALNSVGVCQCTKGDFEAKCVSAQREILRLSLSVHKGRF